MNKKLQEKYLKNIEGNVNVGKIDSGVEFIFLVVALFAIIGVFSMFADNLISFCIDRMPNETQVRLERAISLNTKNLNIVNDADTGKLSAIVQKVVAMDSKLQRKSNFPIYVVNNDKINAFIAPDGAIFVTSKLTDTIKNEEILAFVIAHELGHYANRDHLKSIGKEIAKFIATTALSGSNSTLETTLNGISGIHELKHSRKQEKKADKYASNAIYKLYGSTKGGVNFFKLLKNKENSPLFIEYLSTHPSTESRIKAIKKFKRN